MAEITLTKGCTVTVDDADFGWLNSYKWYAQGVEGRAARRIRFPRNTIIYIYHQILDVNPWELRTKNLEVDHIDRNIANCRRDNLRIVTHATNMLNSKTSLNKTGVGYDSLHNRWKAYIDRPHKSRINIGTFRNKIDALAAVENFKKDE